MGPAVKVECSALGSDDSVESSNKVDHIVANVDPFEIPEEIAETFVSGRERTAY